MRDRRQLGNAPRKAARDAAGVDSLDRYRAKRRGGRTSEPATSAPDTAGLAEEGDLFVVQKHAARRLHYDLRLQLGDTLKSWAVTKGPSLDPADRRLAVHVEDHPLDYATFEGTIPKGEYGGGGVIVWDRGRWVPVGDPEEGYLKGRLKFRLIGEKLRGGWTLTRMKSRGERGDNWLLIKERDTYARPGEGSALLDEAPESVLSGRLVETLAAEAGSFGAGKQNPRTSTVRRKIAPDHLPGARPAALPAFVAPQLATRVALPPEGNGWVHEIKFDGYRTLARIEGGTVRLLTRTGLDWTHRYGQLAASVGAALECREGLIDGELVVQDASGRSSFAALQDALSKNQTPRLVYYVFDLIYLDGFDLGEVPLIERKAILADLLELGRDDNFPVQLSEHIVGNGSAFFTEACRQSLEGIVCKSAAAPYRAGRTRTWLKVKTRNFDDFVVVGFTESDAAGGLAALLLAEADEGRLTYVGRCGTGFSHDAAEDLRRRLRPLARTDPPLNIPMETDTASVTWTEPALSVDVAYSTRTTDGLLRTAAFRGIRSALPEKEPMAVSKNNAVVPLAERAPAARPRRAVSDADLASVWVTNPDRVMFGRGGPTKLDLAVYYAAVADWMLPELSHRPVSLVRCPQGGQESCFFQRHAGQGMPESVKRVALREESSQKQADYLYIDDGRGFLALAQFGTVEFHPWGCRVDKPERPDRMIFDLDPDEGLRWSDVVRAAVDIRDRLDQMGLVSFVKTTGGKGLHVVVPVARRHPWSAIFRFSEAFASGLAQAEPHRFTASMAKARRRDRIFVDFHRNRRSSTAVAAYSLRARPGAPASVPVAWPELADIENPADLNWTFVPRWLRERPDPWSEINSAARALTQEMARTVGAKLR